MGETAITMDAPHGAAMEKSPLGIRSNKLAMWLFIVADGATFGALLFGYGYLRYASPNWTRPFAFSPTILNAFGMTIILLTSSLTMLAAVAAAKTGNRSSTIKWLAATMALGAVFAALHLHEWYGMMGEGWSLGHNPLGGSTLVGTTFFSITGLHILHVVAGIVAVGVIAIGFNRERFNAGHVETTGLYWHFDNLVWMFVFPLVYLLNTK